MTDNSTIGVHHMPAMVNDFTLSTWLIEGPFHLMWSQWMCSLVHLRGEHQGKPARLQFPEATHELVILAQHPDHPLTRDSTPDSLRPMTPIDVAQQFRAADDAAALKRIEGLLDMVRNGRLSPDQDFRSVWRQLLTEHPAGV